MSSNIIDYFDEKTDPGSRLNNIPESMERELPDRIAAFGKEFQKHWYRRQGSMKLCFSDDDNEKFLKIPAAQPNTEYIERVIQAVVSTHNHRKLKEHGIPTIVDEYSIEPLVIENEPYIGLYSDLVDDSEACYSIPPLMEEEYRDELKTVGETILELTKEGEVAYLENQRSWTEDITRNRFIDLEENYVGVYDMGELGPHMFRDYGELAEDPNNPYNTEEGFVFYDENGDWSYQTPALQNESEFIEKHNLDEEITELLDPRMSEFHFVENIENARSPSDQYEVLRNWTQMPQN